MKVLVASANEARREALRKTLAQLDCVTSLAALDGGLDGRTEQSINTNTDVILLDASHDPMKELDSLEKLQAVRSGFHTVLLAPGNDPQILLRALRLGVKEVLTPDTVEAELEPAFERISKITTTRGSDKAKVMVFASTKGGSGATFLAANFAFNLARKSKAKVVLIDLDLRSGNAHLMLSARKPIVSIADLAREINRVDSSFLESSMIDIEPNLGVIAAPEDPAQASEVKASHIEKILSLASEDFDYIVLDIGRAVVPTSIGALDMADHIFPVCQLSVPNIREARRLIHSLRALDYSPGIVKPLLNRYERSKTLRTDDLERAIGLEVFMTIPNQYAVVMDAINQGKSVADIAKGSGVNKAIDQMVAALTDVGEKPKGWLSRVMSR